MPLPIADGRPIRWGILGAGFIADTVSGDINLTDGNVVTAVAARDANRAAGFADRHGVGRSYGDCWALVNVAKLTLTTRSPDGVTVTDPRSTTRSLSCHLSCPPLGPE